MAVKFTVAEYLDIQKLAVQLVGKTQDEIMYELLNTFEVAYTKGWQECSNEPKAARK
jgi:hypothetical protein